MRFNLSATVMTTSTAFAQYLIRDRLGKELARHVGSPSAESDPSSILASYIAFKSLNVCDNRVPRTLHNIISDTT
jgi:hypothetical protein